MITKSMLMRVSVCALAVLGSARAASAVVVANLGPDYQPAALGQTSATVNAGAGIADTAGTGRWNYIQGDTGGANPTLLTFKSNPGNSGLPAYAGTAGTSESGFSMPALANTKLFSTGTTPVADALNFHPGNENPREIIAQWTVGSNGLYNLAGTMINYNAGNGVNTFLRINGVNQSPDEISNANREVGYNYLSNLNAGDLVSIVVDSNGNFGNDETGVRFRATQLEGRLLANVGGDYVPAQNGQTSASINIVDTAGQGTWRYFGSDNINIDATANEQLGVFGVVGDSGNSGYGDGLNGFNLSAVSDRRLFTSGETPLADELSIHPADSTRPFEVLRWTAGVGEAGLVNVVGNIRNPVIGGDGIEFYILVDGVQMFSAVSTGNTLPMSFFDFKALVSVGSTIDFVQGRRAGFGFDESILSAFIVQAATVPEPATLTLMALAGMFTLGRRSKSRRA